MASDLAALRQAYAAILQSEGSDAFVEAMFTSDGAIMTPGQQTYTGMAALKQFAAQIPPEAAPLMADVPEHYVCAGDDYAVGYGGFPSGSPFVRVLNLWRRKGDTWKIYLNIDTGDTGIPATTVAP